jgi:hypothetical protein
VTRHAWNKLALVATVSVAVGLSPLRASAAAIAPGGQETEVEEAKRLYDEGLAHYETHDYKSAVEKWTLAYSKLPDDATGQKNALVYNIATAQEKAYELDKDVEHLRQAQLLLESYVKTYKAMFKKTNETKAEVDKANARIETLREKIAAAERGDAMTPPAPVPLETPPEDDDDDDDDEPPPTEAEKKAKKMIVTGWVLAGIGSGALVVGVSALGTGTVANRDGLTYFGAAALVVGVGLAAGGGALIGIGYKRRREARQNQVTVAPMLAPGLAGAGVSGRF